MHLQSCDDSSTRLSGTSCPGEERRLSTGEFSPALFYEVAAPRGTLPPHPEALLWPREVGPLGLRQALTGGGPRPFSRWLTRDYRALFPRLPARTRLLRLLKTPQDWTRVCVAAPTVLGVIDPYGLARIPPLRAGRSPQQMGRTGVAHHRGMVGGHRGGWLHQWGVLGGGRVPICAYLSI